MKGEEKERSAFSIHSFGDLRSGGRTRRGDPRRKERRKSWLTPGIKRELYQGGLAEEGKGKEMW